YIPYHILHMPLRNGIIKRRLRNMRYGTSNMFRPVERRFDARILVYVCRAEAQTRACQKPSLTKPVGAAKFHLFDVATIASHAIAPMSIVGKPL
ncbi:MAG TPA: hypothetical protein VIM99_14820, partial [Blastocatellia bacterium]